MNKELLLAALLTTCAGAGVTSAADAPKKEEAKAEAEPRKSGSVELAYDYKSLDANKDGYVSPDEMNEHDKRRAAAKAAAK